ncbi:telomere-protecting terminal protein Tpg [Kitasatospora sp. NPDC015120]|uniref:telomere-protecting terminal protein Tpg n=1 Tax=Kitasatospora sp. NPDC015120 TaxID=3364023 RepID=UPI0036F49F53
MLDDINEDIDGISAETAGGREKRGTIADGLERAERAQFTEPIPASTQGRVGFLLGKLTGGTKALAARLGVSQRTVQRYRAGTVTRPRAAAQEALEDETCEHWQQDVRAEARQRAAGTGFTISTRAVFGFDAGAGTSDSPRPRLLTQRISGTHAAAIIAAREAGATDDQLTDMVGEALADAYFRNEGNRTANLKVRLRDIEYIDMSF